MRELASILAASLMAVAVGFGTATAQNAPELGADTLLKGGTLQLAADFAAAPNQFLNPDGARDGLNVDMCGAIAERLGLELEWTNLAFPGLVPGLQAKRYDALCTAIFINPDRLQIMNMVPYVQWGEGLMVPKESTLGGGCEFKSGEPESYNGCFDSLAGKTVAVAAAGTTNQHLTAQSERMVAAGLEAIEMRAFDTNADTLQAVASGQADAAYVNDPQAYFFINRTDDGFKVAFEGNSPNKLALATLKENVALAEALQWALEQMKADGSYEEILKKWGVAAVPDFAMSP